MLNPSKKSDKKLSERVNGLKWTSVGTTRPRAGTELINEELSAALLMTNDFSRAEWAKFRVKKLRADHFVRSGTSYLQPALVEVKPSRWWLKRTMRTVMSVVMSVVLKPLREMVVEAIKCCEQAVRAYVQRASRKKAMKHIAMWFLHDLTTVLIMEGQESQLTEPRDGWQLFEQALTQLKQAPIQIGSEKNKASTLYYLDGNSTAAAMRRVIHVSTDLYTSEHTPKPRPPLKPSELLRRRGLPSLRNWPSLYDKEETHFRNEADRLVACKLYEKAVRERLHGLVTVAYERFVDIFSEAIDEEGYVVSETALWLALREVGAINVSTLQARGETIEAAEQPERLFVTLGEVLAELPLLRTLELYRVTKLCDEIFPTPGQPKSGLRKLHTLRLIDCMGPNVVSRHIATLRKLRVLDLSGCNELTRLPDLSRGGCCGPALRIEGDPEEYNELSEALAQWRERKLQKWSANELEEQLAEKRAAKRKAAQQRTQTSEAASSKQSAPLDEERASGECGKREKRMHIKFTIPVGRSRKA
jgi:hypothetical protein